MHVEWYGQSAFRLAANGTTVFLDPFGDMSALVAARGMQFDYPTIEGVEADLLLITHEHLDHNVVDAIGGSPVVLRSTAGRLDSPLGEVAAIASEHDAAAGTERGPNTIFAFDLDGSHVCHFGDFGQDSLRDARRQRSAGPICCSFRSAAARQSAPSRPRRSPAAYEHGGSCRCITARRASTSSSRRTRSSSAC